MLDLMNKQQGGHKQTKRIALATAEKTVMREMKDILYVKADANYCNFFFEEEKPLLISKNLGFFQESLDPYDIVRVSRYHLVNLYKVEAFQRDGNLKLENQEEIRVSPGKREMVMKRLREL